MHQGLKCFCSTASKIKMLGLSMNYVLYLLVIYWAGWSLAKSVSDSKCSSSSECGTHKYCDTVDGTCRHCTSYPCSPGVMKTSEAMCNKTCPRYYWKLMTATSQSPLDEATDTVIGGERNTDNKSPNIILIVSLSALCLSVITVVVLTYLRRKKIKLYAEKLCITVNTPVQEDGDNVRTNNNEKQAEEEENLQRLLYTPKEQV